jgi:hypothetical protein
MSGRRSREKKGGEGKGRGGRCGREALEAEPARDGHGGDFDPPAFCAWPWPWKLDRVFFNT